MAKFPKELLVWKENEGESQEFLSTAEKTADAAPNVGEKRQVAVYVLKETVELKSETRVVSRRRA